MRIVLSLLVMTTFLGYAQTLPLPARASGADSGSAFAEKIKDYSLEKRENAIFEEIRQGNVPDFLRRLVPITVTKGSLTATYHVTPDYMCIGSNSDYFLTPMTPLLAQRLADVLDCSLPTTKMVADIWSQAVVKMPPTPIPPNSNMTTVPVFVKHNTTVYQQRSALTSQYPLGSLVGGNKKDVVVTKRLESTPKRVAIYGWHRTNGSNIQPLYLGHGDYYADYSHGIRFVQNDIVLNGENHRIRDILASDRYSSILSSEGVLRNPRYPVAVSSDNFPLNENFTHHGRDLSMWEDKFTAAEFTTFQGENIAVVKDPSGGMDSMSLQTNTANMYVQADIYCEYQPEKAQSGYERVGIFLRDDGDAAFEHTYGGGGSCYGMAWDSNNGRLWCFRADEGRIKDLSEQPIYMTGTSWRTMRVEAQGSTITFIFDGMTVLSVTDTKYSNGGCGVGYHEYFSNNSLIQGTRVRNFQADKLD